jgi:predicted murein hydrolase (TIGR00659 family)
MLAKISTSSTVWLPLTIGIYYAATLAYGRSGKAPFLNPTLLTIACVGALLLSLGVSYADYFRSVSIIHYLLGTAVVALAIPLHRNLQRLDLEVRVLAAALLSGSLTSVVSGLIIAKALGASPTTLLSLAPKSATAAVSMEIARGIGGVPAVAACLTILTGIIGAVVGPYILTMTRVTSPAGRGLALGVVSHGIATARAFSEDETTGCWASLGMCLNAILTAILVPLIVGALGMIGK